MAAAAKHGLARLVARSFCKDGDSLYEVHHVQPLIRSEEMAERHLGSADTVRKHHTHLLEMEVR